MTKIVTLGEICKITSGGTPNREKNEYFNNGLIPWVRTGDLKVKNLYTVESFITDLGIKNSSAKMFPENTVLLAMYGATIGACSILRIPATTNQACAALLPSEVITPEFLYYFLAKSKENLIRSGVGGAQPNISGSIIKNYPILLPPLPEQRRIAALLDHADALRQKDRQLLAHYDKLAQSLFLDLFGDPVTNEKGWKKLSFGEIGDSRLGKMLDAKQQTGSNQFPYLGNSNVQWGRFKLEGLLKMDFNEKDRREFELRNGDLLICEGGEVGRTAIWRGQLQNCFFQKALHRVRLDLQKAIPEYVQALMWNLSQKNGFKDFTTVATIAHLTGVKLKSMPIIIPPLSLQNQFAQLIEKIEQQKAVVRQQMAASEALFGRLLQESFGA